MYVRQKNLRQVTVTIDMSNPAGELLHAMIRHYERSGGTYTVKCGDCTFTGTYHNRADAQRALKAHRRQVHRVEK